MTILRMRYGHFSMQQGLGNALPNKYLTVGK